MHRNTLQIGGEETASSPRNKPAVRKATSPYTPANRNPLTGEIIRFPGYDDGEDDAQRNAQKQPPAITPGKTPKTIDSNGVADAIHANSTDNQTNGHTLNHHAEASNPVIITTNGSSDHDAQVPDLSRLQISENNNTQQQQLKTDTGNENNEAAARKLYDKYVQKGESGNAAHHRIRLDDQFTNVVKSLLPERIVELCHNQVDMTMSSYNADKTCAKLPFIARVVTTRLPHVCDDIVGCLFVRGGRAPHSAGGARHMGGGENIRSDNSKSASKQQTSQQPQPSSDAFAIALFYYKPLSGKRAPLLQPFVSCSSLRHVTGWKKGAVIGLSDLYAGAEFSIQPREELKQQQQAVHGKKKQQIYHQDAADADEHHEKGKMQLSALANELLAADRYMTLKVMWLDESIQQQCAGHLGMPLAMSWAGADTVGGGGIDRIQHVFAVREKIAEQLRNIPSWKTVCFDIFGRLVSHCLAALQNTEINTRDENETDANPARLKESLAHDSSAMTTMTKQQLSKMFAEAPAADSGQRLVLDEAEVDAIFEHLLSLRAGGAGGDTVNTLHLADFIAFSWTSEHEIWLLRKAYRKLDPSCVGVVTFKTLESFTCARNATLTTQKGVREISSFTGLGGEVKEMFDDFIAGLKQRSPNGITYYDLACFVNTLAVNDGWKQPENEMDRASLIAWSIKRLFTVDD